MSTYGSRLAEKAHEPGKAMRWLWLSLLLLFVDQASKYLASTMLAHGESVPAAPFFNWVHRHNTGGGLQLSRGCRRLAAAAFHRTGPGYLDITGVLALAFTTRTELSARPQCDPRRRVGQCRRSLAVRLRRGFSRFSLCPVALAIVQPSGRMDLPRCRPLYLGGNTTSTRQPPPLNRLASSLSHA